MKAILELIKIALPVTLLLTTAYVVPTQIMSDKGIKRVKRLQKEVAELKESCSKIQQENDTLVREIQSFHTNPKYLEKIARDELGMVKTGEVIYQFP